MRKSLVKVQRESPEVSASNHGKKSLFADKVVCTVPILSLVFPTRKPVEVVKRESARIKGPIAPTVYI
jgi:hypothetical protein